MSSRPPPASPVYSGPPPRLGAPASPMIEMQRAHAGLHPLPRAFAPPLPDPDPRSHLPAHHVSALTPAAMVSHPPPFIPLSSPHLQTSPTGLEQERRPAAPLSALLSAPTYPPSRPHPSYPPRAALPGPQRVEVVPHPAPAPASLGPSPPSTYGRDPAGYASSYDEPYAPTEAHRPSIIPAGSIRPETRSDAPAGVRDGPSPNSLSRYEITVRQQPLAARACGFGERDRRVIDPPPIVQLRMRDAAADKTVPDELRYPFNVVHCTLWNVDATNDETALQSQDRKVTRRLMGTLVSSPFVGIDERDQEGCFFCFPDLSCRTNGQYRLRFVLMRIEATAAEPGGYTPIITETTSEVFTVFTAKDFPGMRASTTLTKALKRQGCAISVKKGNEKTGQEKTGTHARDDDSGADEPDEPAEGEESGRGKKRRKR